jgi:hypothetical protein
MSSSAVAGDGAGECACWPAEATVEADWWGEDEARADRLSTAECDEHPSDGLMRVRGMEGRSPSGYAEAFRYRKLSLGSG